MTQDLRGSVIEALKTVYDPEIPVNIYELGLIYDIEISQQGDVLVKMTLTAPNCPVAEILPNQVQQKLLSVEGVVSAAIDLVFDPPWDRDKMSDAAKLALGFDIGLDVAPGPDRNVVPLSKLQR
jgi:FeS assembly SUF system protein